MSSPYFQGVVSVCPIERKICICRRNHRYLTFSEPATFILCYPQRLSASHFFLRPLSHLRPLLHTEKALRNSSFAGSIFEGYVASELVKNQINQGKRKGIYYFRDQQGLEVDFIVPLGNGKLRLLEVKATRTPKPEMAASMTRLSDKIKSHKTESQLVYWPSAKTHNSFSVLRPGVRAVPAEGIIDI